MYFGQYAFRRSVSLSCDYEFVFNDNQQSYLLENVIANAFHSCVASDLSLQ